MEPQQGSIITSPNMMERFRVQFTKMVNDAIVWHYDDRPANMPLNILGGGKPMISNDDPLGVVEDGLLTPEDSGGVYTTTETVMETEGPYFTIPSYRVKYTDYDTENGEYIWGGIMLAKGGMSVDVGGWTYVRGGFKQEIRESNGSWFWGTKDVNSRNFEISRRRTITREVTIPVPGAPRGNVRVTGDIIEAEDVAGTMGAYLSLFSRVRKMHFIDQFGTTNMALTQEQAETGNYPITYSDRVNAIEVAHNVAPNIDLATGISKAKDYLDNDTQRSEITSDKVVDDIITAADLNRALDQLIADWEANRDAAPTPIVMQFCHSSCHFSCHSSSGRR